MSGRGKGRISNELVAASCAAVLAVYAAGYWRTREEARRIDARAQERAPVAIPAPAPEVPDVPVPARTAPMVAAKTPPVAPVQRAAASTSETTVPAITAMAEPASPPAAISETTPVLSGKWRDGAYTGWGTSRHGDIKAQVVIRDGRIVEAGIASCETRYPCDVIGDIIPQPVVRQSPDVDRVSRATESADAYYFALVEALKDAQVPAEGQTPSSP